MKKTIINEVWQFNKAIHIRFEEDFGAKNGDDLTVVQGMVVVVLADRCKEHLGAKDLQKIFALSKATISETLSSLEEKGFITVDVSEKDKRCKNILLTPRAEEYVKLAHKKFCKMENDLAEGIDEEELKIFRKVARQMKHNVLGRKK